MPITIQDIADNLNLPYSTVANVLQGRSDLAISPATREQVLQIAQQMGYIDSPSQCQPRKPTGHLGLWMSSIYTAFHAQIINHVENNARSAGYQLIVRSLQHGLNGSVLPELNIDGCLAFECSGQVMALETNTQFNSLPTVCMGGVNCHVPSLDCVEIDLATGTLKALAHLAAVGCRAIAYLGPNMIDNRLSAYFQFADDIRQEPITILTPTQSKQQARQAVCEFAGRGRPFDGVYCFNDDMAIACVAGLRDAGLSVPRDVAVVGCDGIEEAGLCDPPITSLAMPVDEMCRIAISLLHDRIVDSSIAPRHRQLSPYLVLRDSSNRTVEQPTL